MSIYIIHIKNNTTYTPEVTKVTLTNCDWLLTQEIYNGQAINSGGVAQGTVQPNSGFVTYKGTLTVHYSYVAPGPNGADVKVDFGVDEIEGKRAPFIGGNTTNNCLDIDWEIQRENDDFIGFLYIFPQQNESDLSQKSKLALEK